MAANNVDYGLLWQVIGLCISSSHHSYPSTHVKIKTDVMLSNGEGAWNPEDPANKLEVRVRRLQHWLTSVKSNNQQQDLEIHMYTHKFIYRASGRTQETEGSAGRQLDESEERWDSRQEKRWNERVLPERGKSRPCTHLTTLHSSAPTEIQFQKILFFNLSNLKWSFSKIGEGEVFSLNVQMFV